MTKSSINIQDGFLFQALKAGDQISVQLTTGSTLEGQLKRFDRFAIVLDVGGREQMVYKHGIVLIDAGTITESAGTIAEGDSSD